jgi:DNA-binding MarR family transcriptional regulator
MIGILVSFARSSMPCYRSPESEAGYPRRLRLTLPDLRILAAIARLGDDAYARLIAAEVPTRKGKTLTKNDAVTRLGRLERFGFLASRMEDGKTWLGRRRRRIYSLTGEGKRALALASASLAIPKEADHA